MNFEGTSVKRINCSLNSGLRVRMDHQKPRVDEKKASSIAKDMYGLSNISEVKELTSYYDKNFLIEMSSISSENSLSSIKFVLKVLNSIDSQHPKCVLAEIKAMEFLASKGFPCPKVFPLKKDTTEQMATADLDGGDAKKETHLVRLFNFLDGTTAEKIDRCPEMMYTIGAFIGRMSQQLKEFSHPGIKLRTSLQFKWDILEFIDIEKYICACQDVEEIKLIHQVHEAFMTLVKPHLNTFRSGTIHNDLNGENILVSHPPCRITGVIDFGDMIQSLLISEVANSMAYFMHGDRGNEYVGHLLAGYQSIFPLPDVERELLYYIIAARLCQLVMYSRSNLNQDPNQADIQDCLRKYYGILVNYWGERNKVEQIWSRVKKDYID